MSELDLLLAREAIRIALARLARGEDRRDAGLIASAFWPDAVIDFGVFRGTFAEYLAWVVPGSDAITNTQHVLGQSHIDLQGHAARSETQVISYHRVDFGGGDEHDTCMGGRYLDHFERRSGEWRIAARTMVYDWSQDWGKAADWSQGLMGMPFSTPHYSGRAHGDRSETFFREMA
ncbi:nuclear transport factor 2 family protein [Sphingomonas sp. 35-24ZXX]|uniref:nuclear transport factor 2 family protein n=1 Tax=Sphingomonas sp. 35-24ZXX TaxID=1545915 RepID=UPI00053BEBEF|nr:nuclear transport factor 2 family protein [Sphingomonas sp. 35-24ZXX]